jgi:hypothetical protein
VAALLDIAAAQADAECLQDVAASLALARQAAADLGRGYDRDHALNLIAQSWALHGHPERAIELAADIGNEDQRGEALITAALAIIARDRASRPMATTVMDGVTSPGWRAIGLTAVRLARPDGHSMGALPHFTDVEELIGKIPEGEGRARAQRGIIEVAVAAGAYEIALRVARTMAASRAQVLSELIGELSARGAADSVKSLLTDCARQMEPAYAACVALARTAPDQVEAILKEVAVTV